VLGKAAYASIGTTNVDRTHKASRTVFTFVINNRFITLTSINYWLDKEKFHFLAGRTQCANPTHTSLLVWKYRKAWFSYNLPALFIRECKAKKPRLSSALVFALFVQLTKNAPNGTSKFRGLL
jgi:hypothetical protein